MNQPRVRAPKLPSARSRWLNTAGEPVVLEKGRLYLLDFFTFGCINCVHVLSDLAYLEARYRGAPFTVVGIHSSKFPRERDAGVVRSALARLDIRHPVLLDPDHETRRAFTVRAWPTLVLIDAEGYIVLTVSGEGNRDLLDRTLGQLLKRADDSVRIEPEITPASPHDAALRFPGSVVAEPAAGRLFIADTGHHRLVIAPLDAPRGTSCRTIGDGEPGFCDGPWERARFRVPQGMALAPDGRTLFVADTGNHAIRRVDLLSRTVRMVAGNGRQIVGAIQSGAARAVCLNSPWDIAFDPNDATRLFIAMAGSHQIVLLDLAADTIHAYAGSGREARIDGSPNEAAFAQPSGITADRDRLYVADAESSSIRAVDLGPGARVGTLVGGADLFDFGDEDGTSDVARFQHPSGIAVSSGRVFVSDTYNDKIRAVDLTTHDVTTVAEGMRAPAGMSAIGDDALFAAERDGHRICRVDVRTGAIVAVALPGLCSPRLCFPIATCARRREEVFA